MMGVRDKGSSKQNPNEPDGKDYDSRICMQYFYNGPYQIVYDYRVQTVWDELIKLSGLPTLLFYIFNCLLGEYQLHIADIDMVEDIERMGEPKHSQKGEHNRRNGPSMGMHNGHSGPMTKGGGGQNGYRKRRAISQMYEHGHFNFLKMYLLQDN